MDKTNLTTRNYYSGITIFKLMGSIMIMIFHVWTVKYQSNDYSYFVSVGQSVVPVFFLISGFLLYDSLNRRDNPIVYLKSRVRNYLFAFAIMEVLVFYQYYLPQIYNSGISLYLAARYIGDILLAFTFSQLWFIPPFILGTIISGIIFIHKKETKYLYPIVTLAIIAAIIYQLLPFWKVLIKLKNKDNYEYMRLILELPRNYLTSGIFLVYIGMYLSKYKDRMTHWRVSKWLPPLILITWLEAFIYHRVFHWDPPFIGLAIYPWAFIFTVFILNIKKPNLKKYNSYINIFSIVTFFLHVFESRLLGYDYLPILKCIIIILINIAITIIVVVGRNVLNTKIFYINHKLIKKKKV